MQSLHRRATTCLVISRPRAGEGSRTCVQGQSGQKTERHGTLHSEGFLCASAETPPRCGVTLDGVKRFAVAEPLTHRLSVRRRKRVCCWWS